MKKVRQFVRSHLTLKNILSNIELTIKTLLRRPILVDYERDPLEYYATAHVWAGHIPSPLMWGITKKFGKFIRNENSHSDCIEMTSQYLVFSKGSEEFGIFEYYLSRDDIQNYLDDGWTIVAKEFECIKCGKVDIDNDTSDVPEYLCNDCAYEDFLTSRRYIEE